LQELVYCGIWTFFYFTAATAVATLGFYEDPFAAAAVSFQTYPFHRNFELFIELILLSFQFFGYLAMIFYGFDAYLKYISWKAGEIAQGDRVVSKTTSSSNNH